MLQTILSSENNVKRRNKIKIQSNDNTATIVIIYSMFPGAVTAFLA